MQILFISPIKFLNTVILIIITNNLNMNRNTGLWKSPRPDSIICAGPNLNKGKF